tara:strand:- start:919 stop:1887 length:969 start_codon:yes stop_codon:yes gene_type:complete
MLEQAIIDAKALRDAAIESAEEVVVERYSNQIKETVEALLEQEDGPEAEDADATFAQDLDSQLPEAHHPEIDDDQILEIDLSNIEIDDEDVKLVSEEENKEEVVAEGVEEVTAAAIDAELEEDIELEEEDLKELAETLKFDYEKVPDGGFANGQMTPTNYIDDTEMVAEIAAMIEEYESELKKENVSLKEENETLKEKIKNLVDGNEQIVETVSQIQNKFGEVQLMNAKLHYSNRALTDASLNERQKQQVVESINEADSIEKAKIVFETLQSTVGTSKKGQESLSEVVGKRTSSSILLKSKKLDEKKEFDFTGRMRRLAGLK